MTSAHVFQATLICADCAISYKQDNPCHVNEADESSYDSGEWPKGPYPDGGGEADSPQHCDRCGVFLDNPLTPDGEKYVLDEFLRFIETGEGSREVLATWRSEYDYVFGQVELHLDPENLPDRESRRYEWLEQTY